MRDEWTSPSLAGVSLGDTSYIHETDKQWRIACQNAKASVVGRPNFVTLVKSLYKPGAWVFSAVKWWSNQRSIWTVHIDGLWCAYHKIYTVFLVKLLYLKNSVIGNVASSQFKLAFMFTLPRWLVFVLNSAKYKYKRMYKLSVELFMKVNSFRDSPSPHFIFQIRE